MNLRSLARHRMSVILASAVAALVLVSPATGQGTRVSEAVVVPGSLLMPFDGALPSHLWLWSFSDGEWHLRQVQLDERAADGSYVELDTGVLDDRDELVFMAEHLGEPAPDHWPAAMGEGLLPAEIRVTDPILGDTRYAYLFHSPTGPEIALPPLVTYDPDSGLIGSATYRLGLADQANDGFIGVKSLALFNSNTDILDRFKVRVVLSVLGARQTLNEETLSEFLGGAGGGDVVKAGPIRVILDPTGTGVAYHGRLRLANGLEAIDPSQIPPLVQVERIALAMDWLPNAGQGTYRDANTAGVPVDGAPDSVATSPLTPWRELVLPAGRIVFLNRAATAGSMAVNYYRDSLTGPADDTGDGVTWGEFGVEGTRLQDIGAAGFPGDMVFFPADGAPNAADLLAQRERPLEVTVSFGGAPTQTLPPPTATETPEPGVTPSPTERTPPATPVATFELEVTGSVTAAGSGLPVAGAVVSVATTRGACGDPQSVGPDGLYQAVCPEAYVGTSVTVHVTAAGYRPASAIRPVLGTSGLTVNIALEAAQSSLYLPVAINRHED